jgi:hypothetical protein
MIDTKHKWLHLRDRDRKLVIVTNLTIGFCWVAMSYLCKNKDKIYQNN